jgi:hypothetical protein
MPARSVFEVDPALIYVQVPLHIFVGSARVELLVIIPSTNSCQWHMAQAVSRFAHAQAELLIAVSWDHFRHYIHVHCRDIRSIKDGQLSFSTVIYAISLIIVQSSILTILHRANLT